MSKKCKYFELISLIGMLCIYTIMLFGFCVFMDGCVCYSSVMGFKVWVAVISMVSMMILTSLVSITIIRLIEWFKIAFIKTDKKVKNEEEK